MSLYIYNTLHGKKEEFKPVTPGKVRMYTCGPTVYNYVHLGNARAFIVPDMMKRYLFMKGYEVTHVQNITDIEDKIIQQSLDEGVDYRVIVDRYTAAYMEDMDALGWLRPDVSPKASEHVTGMIEMIGTLIERGHAYVQGGDVLFAVTSLPSYGALSGQSLEALEAGARVDVDEGKRHPADFTLWKAAKPGEPQWQSPWGPGRPGWHIECSVMSSTYLGQPFDIHTGGSDLIFPHHENEIAQSEGATGKPFAHFWIHNGYINVDGEKMAKSKGNFFMLRDILKKYSAQVVRLFLVSKHYRSPIEFNEEVMQATERGYQRLVEAASALRRAVGLPAARSSADEGAEQAAAIDEAVARCRQQFIAGMDDDFNSAVALAALYDLGRAMNRWTAGLQGPVAAPMHEALASALNTFEELAGVLGLTFEATGPAASDDLVDALMQLVIEMRQEARKAKQYAQADRIRDALAEMGIILEDGPQGTRWRRQATRPEEADE